MKSMVGMQSIRWALLILSVSMCAVAQNNPQPQPDTTPSPAFGQTAPVLNPDNPPVTGLDEPSLELRTATRSFFSPALQVSESANTNGGNQLGGSDVQSITRLLGAFDLQQFWPKSDLYLEYLGGGAFYANPYDVRQVQAAGLEAVTRWRTGQVTLRDSFSYLPDGSFQIGYGGVPGIGLASGAFGIGVLGGGVPGINVNDQFSSVGKVDRLANTAIIDAVQAINPRSAITTAFGFSNAHFFDPTNTFVNSDQYTAQGGYTRLLNRHDQLGLIYGFQLFQFPQSSGGQIYNHVVNVRWSHSITGKLSLVAGVGPQYTDLQEPGGTSHWSVSARVQVRYKMGHTSISATYQKFTSAGSGFFGGADTQAAVLGFKHPLGRTWDLYGDLGYSHNKRLDQTFGVNATSYNDFSAGVVFRKHLGRSYDAFGAYRFSELAFNQTVDNAAISGRVALRHMATIGLEWHPRPTRID